MIRIGLLPNEPIDRPNGVNRYIHALLDGLPETELVSPPIGLRDAARRLRGTSMGSRSTDSTSMRTRPSLRLGRGRSTGRLDDYDVVHVPYERIHPGVSLRGNNVIATVMGLGGLAGANPVPEARRLDTIFVEAMQRLDDVSFITPSNATRRVLCDVVGVEPSSVNVIPLGVDHEVFFPIEPSAPRLPARPTTRPYLLHVGPYSVRKNSQLLLEAFVSSRRHDSLPHALVWAGAVDRKALLRDAARLGITDQVVIAGPLPDAELADAYRGATALCAPSRYEGFGLPVLEAMACGTPVIVSDSPALVELTRDAALVVRTASGPPELAAAIGRVAGSNALRHELGARGIARAASFSWADCAHQHAEQYRRAAGRCRDASGPSSPPPR